MGDPQFTMGFNTRSWSNDLDNLRGTWSDLRNLHISISIEWENPWINIDENRLTTIKPWILGYHVSR